MLETYRGGYTQALLDVKEFFEAYSDHLSHGRYMSKKDIRFASSVLDAMIFSRDSLMEYGLKLMDVTIRPDKSVWIH